MNVRVTSEFFPLLTKCSLFKSHKLTPLVQTEMFLWHPQFQKKDTERLKFLQHDVPEASNSQKQYGFRHPLTASHMKIQKFWCNPLNPWANLKLEPHTLLLGISYREGWNAPALSCFQSRNGYVLLLTHLLLSRKALLLWLLPKLECWHGGQHMLIRKNTKQWAEEEKCMIKFSVCVTQTGVF